MSRRIPNNFMTKIAVRSLGLLLCGTALSNAQSLLTPDSREQYIAEIAADYDRIRTQHAGKKSLPMISIEAARKNKMQLSFEAAAAPLKPAAPRL